MGGGVDFRGLIEEAGVVDGAVVEGCDDEVVFVGDEGVAYREEAVGRAGEEEVGGCWVEGEFGYVVGVDFGVGDLGGGRRRAEVPEEDGGLVVG